jgi:hypothetical protein
MKYLNKLMRKKCSNFPSVEFSGFNGHIDGFNGQRLWGWANDTGNEESVELSLTVNDSFVKSFIANDYRMDLDEAGVGEGKVAFNEYIELQNIIN